MGVRPMGGSFGGNLSQVGVVLWTQGIGGKNLQRVYVEIAIENKKWHHYVAFTNIIFSDSVHHVY